MNDSLFFLGAAETVTGSKTLVKTSNHTILVDCGLFQGKKELREKNWQTLPVTPSEIDFVLLTHAHLDHIGYLPRLIKDGFNGKIFCTAPTMELAKIILMDSAKIQEEEALLANTYGHTKHKPAKPLYTSEDIKPVLEKIEIKEPNIWFQTVSDIRFRFKLNGHILGSTFVEIEVKGKRIVFSGDIGRDNDQMLFPPQKPTKADVLVVESTYGDRLHSEEFTSKRLQQIINNAEKRNGPLIIASFSVDRAQDFMYEIWKLKKEGKINQKDVYIDTPMGVAVNSIYLKYSDWHQLKKDTLIEVINSCLVVRSDKESKTLASDDSFKIIIAGSGMLNGGRVLNYLKTQLENPNATFLLSGYQAEGTRGRDINEGQMKIKVHGHYYNVKATIENIRTMSSHADQNDLISWMGNISKSPDSIFISHGEKKSSISLAEVIKQKLKWKNIAVPKMNDEYPI
jgi:metallo-beta-lactamase family protein